MVHPLSEIDFIAGSSVTGGMAGSTLTASSPVARAESRTPSGL